MNTIEVALTNFILGLFLKIEILVSIASLLCINGQFLISSYVTVAAVLCSFFNHDLIRKRRKSVSFFNKFLFFVQF